MLQIKTVTDANEIRAIRALQEKNLLKNLAGDDPANEGFLSAEYSIDFLTSMHALRPSIVAKDGDIVAGYALVTLRDVANQHPLLDDLFRTIDKTVYRNRPLRDTNFVVVGQLCVAREYRGQGLVQKMYGKFRDTLHDEFDYCITDVARANPRSLKAHIKTGFEVIDTLTYGGISWDIVLWDWNRKT